MDSKIQKTLDETAQKEDKKIKVLIIDDSPLMCIVVSQILSEDERFEIVGRALNGREALEILKTTKCDLCTLDVNMPGMNGLTVLKHIMIRYPTPTLMVSAFTSEGSKVSFDALRYGAIDFFHKPSMDNAASLAEQGEQLRRKAINAARVQLRAAQYLRLKKMQKKSPPPKDELVESVVIMHGAIGSYASVLNLLPLMEETPKSPIIISMAVQGQYLEAFVEYLRGYLPYDMAVASERQEVRPGSLYFIPRELAGIFDYIDGKLILETAPRPELNEKEGGIDLLLLSASEHFGSKTLAIFLSGENSQGSTGAEELLRLSGTVMTQQLETCLRPELPKAILEHQNAKSATLLELAKKTASWS